MPLDFTAVVLTLDEAPNIARVLERLHWVPRVLVVDSGSTDGTQQIAHGFANVQVVEHAFVDFQSQWSFAVNSARVSSPWILALDADYVLGNEIVCSIQSLPDSPPRDAYRASFRYCSLGRVLRGSLYPAKPVLFHADRARYVQRGHTQVLDVDGSIGDLRGTIVHDDRKSQTRWLRSQWRYARDEAALIERTSWPQLSCSGKVRKLLLPAAPLAFAVAMFWRGGVLDGRAGLYYALQRAVAELLISMALLQRRLQPGESAGDSGGDSGKPPSGETHE